MTMLKRFSISDDGISDFYRREGYVVLTDVFAEEELVRARDEIFGFYAITFPGAASHGLGEEALLEHYYAAERERWQRCARRIWDLLSVYRLAGSPRLEALLRTLGLELPIISTRPEVRTDMPADEQYMQPWHQDWRYGQGSINALTIWIPLRDVGVENGTIDVVAGSHLLGYLETEELENPRRFSIVDRRLRELEHAAEPAVMRFGEAIVFSQMLVHRSGFNSSGRARVTIQARFSDAAEPEFRRHGFPTPNGSELVWPSPPSREAMRAVFNPVP